jgi:hypothetical protein
METHVCCKNLAHTLHHGSNAPQPIQVSFYLCNPFLTNSVEDEAFEPEHDEQANKHQNPTAFNKRRLE